MIGTVRWNAMSNCRFIWKPNLTLNPACLVNESRKNPLYFPVLSIHAAFIRHYSFIITHSAFLMLLAPLD
jgi:hypothetical protein